jgi:ADP-L-glycero-D-manno-heptose 6-epimerase
MPEIASDCALARARRLSPAVTSTSPILVTGAAGFIGARFVESCNAERLPVVSVDESEHFETRPEHASIDFGRVVDREELFDWLATDRPRLASITHLGACADTTETDEEYLRRMNVEYSQKIWNHATREKIPLVYASSAATYGGGELGYDDDVAILPRLKPLNLYGQSKNLFDIWALAEEKRGSKPPSWSGFKFFNVYGFGERHKKKMASVVLHAFDQIRAGGSVKLFKSHRAGIADGDQKRDFIAVEDVIDVLHFARTRPIVRGIYNLGTGEARTFLDLARAVFAALEMPERIQFIPTPEEIREKYQYFTEARMERLRAQGYTKPFTSLEKGVATYVARLVGESQRRTRTLRGDS